MLTEVSTKIDLEYAESYVIFGITSCSADKKYSFWKLDNRNQAEDFLSRLQHYEKMTWKQLSSLPRETGLTVETEGSKSYEMIDSQNRNASKLIEKRYFHFRVKDRDLFRVFGYQDKNIFYITHLNTNGDLHH
jgi:hypothetical protein